jgi:PAS domain S-box-containing protein
VGIIAGHRDSSHRPTLPLVDGDQNKEQDAMGHLLIVDNDEDILALLAMGLAAEGYEVRTARSGLEAIRAIEGEAPDVLITDLIMPNISGDKLLNIVHSVPEWSRIRTIVVSGVAIEAPEMRQQIACDIYIAKGPIASTLKYILDSLRNFDEMTRIGRLEAIGTEGIYFRHITRELLDFKEDVDHILDHISDGVCRLDESLSIVWINCAFANLLGKSEEHILGKPIGALFAPEDAATLLEMATGSAGTAYRIAEVRVRADRIARASLLYSFDEDAGHAALLWQDVTDRLLLEEQYENIVESANDLIWTTNLTGHLTYVSRAARRVLGIEPQELVGTPVWEATIPALREEFRRGTMELIEKALTNLLTEPFAAEWPYLHASRQERWAETRTSPLRDRAGRVIGLQGIFSDITEKRALVADKQALLHEIHHRVRDNLQLIGSLSRLSNPEALELRISTLGEVFDELYREKSFSEIQPLPLLERVVDGTVSGTGFGSGLEREFDIPKTTIPMRRAVPLALLVNEIVTLICRRAGGGQRVLRTRLLCAGDESVLTVGIGDLEPLESTGDGEVQVPVEPDSIAGILIDQLGGTGYHASRGEEIRYTVRFSCPARTTAR